MKGRAPAVLQPMRHFALSILLTIGVGLLVFVALGVGSAVEIVSGY